jgi:carbohydrate-selective porin OprB
MDSGVVGSWGELSNRVLQDQYVAQSLYRFYITPSVRLTRDVQVVVDPANAPTKEAVTVFGLRLRTLY